MGIVTSERVRMDLGRDGSGPRQKSSDGCSYGVGVHGSMVSVSFLSG